MYVYIYRHTYINKKYNYEKKGWDYARPERKRKILNFVSSLDITNTFVVRPCSV